MSLFDRFRKKEQPLSLRITEPVPPRSGERAGGAKESGETGRRVLPAQPPSNSTPAALRQPDSEALVRQYAEARDTAGLIGVLDSEESTSAVRQRAVMAMGELADPILVKHLAVALRDKDVHVASLAARALGRIGPESVEALSAALSDPNVRVRSDVTREIARMDDPRVRPVLLQALADTDDCVRLSAACGLVRLGAPPDIAAVEPLLSPCSSNYFRRLLVDDLPNCPGGLHLLRTALRDPEASVRARSAKALGEAADGEAIDALAKALEDSSWDVRSEAAKALAGMHDRRTIEPLTGVLATGSARMRVGAAEALLRFEDPRTAPALAACLGHEDRDVRRACLKCLDAVLQASAAGIDRDRVRSALGNQLDRALLLSADEAAPASVSLLLALGASANVAGDDGITALMLAVNGKREETVRALLAAGADPNQQSAAGGTPLMLAAKNGWPAGMAILLAAHADVNASTADGGTALYYSVESAVAVRGLPLQAKEDPARAEGVRLLLHHGGNPNAANQFGQTPLMTAAWNGRVEAVRLLVEHGADPAIKDNEGNTALALAQKRGQAAICDLLNRRS